MKTRILGQFLQFFLVARITAAQHQKKDIGVWMFKHVADSADEAIHSLLGGEAGDHRDQRSARYVFKATEELHAGVSALVDLRD